MMDRRKHFEENLEFFIEGFKESVENINRILVEADEEPLYPDVDSAAEKMAREAIEEYLKYDDMKCTERIDGIDISGYLRLIRNEDREMQLTIAIKDGKIIDHITVPGSGRFISSLYNEGTNSFLEKYPDAKICFYHNHPRNISAMPSTSDFAAMNRVPQGLIYDWGVVTASDFYSNRQTGSK